MTSDIRNFVRHRFAVRQYVAAGIIFLVGVGLGTLVGPTVSDGKILAHKQTEHHAFIRPRAIGQSKPVPRKDNKKVQPKFAADYSLPPAKNGLAPIVSRLHTTQPVVFLTIDDGAHKDPSDAAMMKDNHVKASIFLAKTFIDKNPAFFKQYLAAGSLIENHTLTHDLRMVRHQGYDRQKEEICGMADYEEAQYGRRPVLFRPPGGAYNETMQRAAHDCGMKAVVTWMATVNNGAVQYQIGDRLQPGDIVLMHFRPTFKEDLQAFIDAAAVAGLRTELLESALPVEQTI